MPFKALGLSPNTIRGVQAMGYTEPTPIQLRAIPAVLAGKDLIGSAQTGTGKTAAFALPILSKLGAHSPRGARVLVLEPTRELAAQVETSFRDLGRFTDIRALVVHGGVGYGHQRKELRDGVDVIVATPGRLLDFMQEGLKLDSIEVLVLDEVDRMLDMGFLPDVKRIILACPDARQTLFFSATVPPEIAAVAAFALRDPVRVEIGINRAAAQTVTHAMYPVAQVQKFELLLALLERTEFDSVLIFSRTKHGADRIARRLKAAGHSVAALHSDRTQNQRVEALEGFKNGRYEVMVATDIAARGIDVAGVTHVINYDVPGHPEDYVHRIGRTGRAQTVGDAFTLMSPENEADVAAIERFIGKPIERLKLENFHYAPYELRPPQPQQQGGGGRGRFNRGGQQQGRHGGGKPGGGHAHGRGQQQGHGGGQGRSHGQGGARPAQQQPKPKKQSFGTARHEGAGNQPAPAQPPPAPGGVRGFLSRLRRGR
ncbi:MAG TPA: DEAD/DEAH box helicase [Opitutaceae bacterium]|nr:DEAD/DEAH box helicase [Opitutaceae bacterium]